jgi:hypothetical protein
MIILDSMLLQINILVFKWIHTKYRLYTDFIVQRVRFCTVLIWGLPQLGLTAKMFTLRLFLNFHMKIW